MSLQPHQQRVVEEHSDLDGKVERLAAFVASDKSEQIDAVELGLLLAQLDSMRAYRTMLRARMARWGAR